MALILLLSTIEVINALQVSNNRGTFDNDRQTLLKVDESNSTLYFENNTDVISSAVRQSTSKEIVYQGLIDEEDDIAENNALSPNLTDVDQNRTKYFERPTIKTSVEPQLKSNDDSKGRNMKENLQTTSKNKVKGNMDTMHRSNDHKEEESESSDVLVVEWITCYAGNATWFCQKKHDSITDVSCDCGKYRCCLSADVTKNQALIIFMVWCGLAFLVLIVIAFWSFAVLIIIPYFSSKSPNINMKDLEDDLDEDESNYSQDSNDDT